MKKHQPVKKKQEEMKSVFDTHTFQSPLKAGSLTKVYLDDEDQTCIEINGNEKQCRVTKLKDMNSRIFDGYNSLEKNRQKST